MPCILSQSNDPSVDFEAKPGSTASISVRSTGADPQSVELDFVRYNGVTIHDDPANIKVVAGRKVLIVGLRGTVDGQMGNLVELCGDGNETKIRRIKFVDLDPVRILLVEGK